MVKEGLMDVEFGPWQWRMFAIIFYIFAVAVWQNLAITFFAPNVEFHCINSTEQCFVQKDNISIECSQWEYDLTWFSETIVSEWDLVCHREWLISLSKSVYMVGFLVSVIFFGQISDWIGRYSVLLISFVFTMSGMLLSLFSSSYMMFVILRFFQAFGRSGLSTTGFVLLMEIVRQKHRTNIGIGVQLGWSFGFVSLAGVAYLIRHWFWLQLVICVSYLPIMFAFPIIPESPRWLLMKGKIEKLKKLLENASKINGREIILSNEDLELLRTQSQVKSQSIFDLFKTPRLRNRTFYMIYLWFVNAFMYFGLSFNTNDLAGNMYINFLISGVLEVPASGVIYLCIIKFGRRPTLVSFMIVGGTACVAVSLAPESMAWMSTSLAMVGKFCITGSFILLYFYTSELFPTVVRNVAIGTCSMWGRVGSIISPFVRELGKATYPWLPNVIYGLLAISSGLLALLLPETKGKKMPDTLEEGECFGKEKTKREQKNSISLATSK